MRPGKPAPATPGPLPSRLSTLLAYLRSLYRRHRRLLWTTLLVFLPYLFFLPFYGYLLRFFAPELAQVPSSPLGHLRFTLLLVLPLLPFALLHLLAAGLYGLLSIPRRPFRPHLRPYLYAALLALVLYYLPGLPYPSAHVSGGQRALLPAAAKLFVPALGGCLTTPDLMATLCIPPGALAPPKPALITLRSLPHTRPAPGPVPPEATLIAAAEVWRTNPYNEENNYFANFFRPPAPLRLSLRHAVAPARNSTHYTEVCSWFGEEGNGFGLKNFWSCHLTDLGPGTDRKGRGYIEVELGGLDSRRQSYYVFQFPKEWANQNCLAAGGTINPNIPAIDFHSFNDACDDRIGGGNLPQIGQLLPPERIPELTQPTQKPIP